MEGNHGFIINIRYHSFILFYKPNPYYPIGITAKGRITAGTENYVKANGVVSLKPKEDGMRNVKIKYKK